MLKYTSFVCQNGIFGVKTRLHFFSSAKGLLLAVGGQAELFLAPFDQGKAGPPSFYKNSLNPVAV